MCPGQRSSAQVWVQMLSQVLFYQAGRTCAGRRFCGQVLCLGRNDEGRQFKSLSKANPLNSYKRGRATCVLIRTAQALVEGVPLTVPCSSSISGLTSSQRELQEKNEFGVCQLGRVFGDVWAQKSINLQETSTETKPVLQSSRLCW